jgi:hypothetical protein
MFKRGISNQLLSADLSDGSPYTLLLPALKGWFLSFHDEALVLEADQTSNLHFTDLTIS